MAQQYAEKQRPLLVYLDGKGPYIATYVDCREGLSKSLRMNIELRTSEVLDSSILGKVCRIDYQPLDKGKRDVRRHFTGLVMALEHQEVVTNKQQHRFRIEATDPLSLLEYRRNSQVFQDMQTRQIIEQILKDAGVKSYFNVNVQNPGTQHEYCVQFEETDAAFVQRLLSFEGWHYHLDTSASEPNLVIADSNQVFKATDPSSVAFSQLTEEREQSIWLWHAAAKVSISSLVVANHSQDLATFMDSGERRTADSSKQSDLAEYHYANGHYDKETVRNAAKLRMDNYDANKNPVKGESCQPGFAPGYIFNLKDHPESSNNRQWLITSVHHILRSSEEPHDREYLNSFTCVPTDGQWRPPFIHKPQINSFQSAMVTGPSGKETNQDKYGRIKVQFDWDTKGKKDENSSCWVPVCQNMAGNGIGVQFIPRIGDAVLIAFIDGDPDRPVIAGSIFNGKNAPVYSTPTQAGIRTHSTPDGNNDNFNELRFEDKKGSEEFYMQAEKDMNLLVKNDLAADVKANLKAQVEKETQLTSKDNATFETDAQMQLKSQKDMAFDSSQNIKATASQDVDISATSNVSIDGQQIKLSGKTGIELSVGGNSIKISPSGVEISGVKVSISGQSMAELKATMVTVQGQATTDVKGAIVNVNGDAMTAVKAGAMVQIQGAIAKIN